MIEHAGVETKRREQTALGEGGPVGTGVPGETIEEERLPEESLDIALEGRHRRKLLLAAVVAEPEPRPVGIGSGPRVRSRVGRPDGCLQVVRQRRGYEQ